MQRPETHVFVPQSASTVQAQIVLLPVGPVELELVVLAPVLVASVTLVVESPLAVPPPLVTPLLVSLLLASPALAEELDEPVLGGSGPHPGSSSKAAYIAALAERLPLTTATATTAMTAAAAIPMKIPMLPPPPFEGLGWPGITPVPKLPSTLPATKHW